MTSAVSDSELPRQQRSWLLRFWLPAFLLGYFVIGLARMGKPEFYPIGSWAMFSTVPNEVTTYRLRVTSIGSKPLNPPVYYGKAEGVLAAPVRISSVAAVRNFGKAIKDHDTQKAERLRVVIESTLLPAETNYEIVEQRYWPIEKWLHNRYDESVIASFRTRSGGE